MKIAVVYNRESRSVINLFGVPNKEKIGMKTIQRVVDALKQGGHQVIAVEGDKDLVDRLEEFMPRVVHGERPGMVFNVSYGIQGQARYTHVPSILEMVGVPYVASGPLAHSLALDKVVTKMILRQHGLPTPDFAVLDSPDAPVPELTFPLIVKPKNEAVSFGLKVVNDEGELREGVKRIYDEFRQPVLAEQYIDGREINVGLLGNNPPQTLPPVEIVFGEGGPPIYTYEDKTRRSQREISYLCPAPIDDGLSAYAQDIARKAFDALGCYDCARADMRMDRDGKLYILEINSLPSLGEHGSYTIGAAHVGLDYAGLVNRLVQVASARYFGTPHPPEIGRSSADASTRIFTYVTQRRDELEQQVRRWTDLHSRTHDPVGLSTVVERLGSRLRDLGLAPLEELTDERAAWTWETRAGLEGGTLLVGHLDVPAEEEIPTQAFRREPEWLYGDGIASACAPWAMVNAALSALRSIRRLRRVPLGVLYYSDEGRDARYSAKLIRRVAERASQVLVLRPGNPGDAVIKERRGQRVYGLRVVGDPMRPGKTTKKADALGWTLSKLEECAQLSARKRRISVSALDVRTEKLPMFLPHRVVATLVVTYPREQLAREVDEQMRGLLRKSPLSTSLELVSDRPPMALRPKNEALLQRLTEAADRWDIPLRAESSVWPSVAGLVPEGVACLCGLGPVARGLGTPQEAVQRISLVQRTLLLGEFLLRTARDAPSGAGNGPLPDSGGKGLK